MGHSVINPVCSIAETVNRGSLASDMRIENRLGAAIAVLYRNGVNAIIPPKLKSVSVNGTIEISIAYRCTDGTLLNQYGNLIAKHPELVNDDSDIPETSFRVKYVITREQLESKDVVYIDDLDLTLSLNPMYGIPEHTREGMSTEDHDLVKNLLKDSYMHKMLVPDTAYKTLYVLHYGDIVEVECVVANVKTPTLETCRLVNGRVVPVRVAAIDRDKVWVTRAEAELAMGVVPDPVRETHMEKMSLTYYEILENHLKMVDEHKRNVAKELDVLGDALVRERARQQLEQLSNIKHTQTVVSEGGKLISALAGLGVKVFG